MNYHNASGQMIGYLYQVYAALILLMQNINRNTQLCIEKFDDISFHEDGKPQELIQSKHHINRKGSLINTSVDFWRTINCWCDSIIHMEDFKDINFVIITTEKSGENTAASLLKNTNSRNINQALLLLEETALAGGVDANKKYYQNFLSLSNTRRKQLVTKIIILDDSFYINDVRNELKNSIRWGTLPKYEDSICERIEGWWFNQAIHCLSSTSPIFIHQKQVQAKIFEITNEYKSDSLPIEVNYTLDPSMEDLENMEDSSRIFIEQLCIISLSSNRLKRAIREYYHAYQQRAKWLREELIYIDELDKYESKLIDEWQRLYLIMKEKVELQNSDEKEKQLAGKELFNKIEDLDIFIRDRVNQPFVMRGTYHMLANKLSVGWHVDFYYRLCHLLKVNS